MLYQPEWDGPIAGYVTNYLARYHWKIQRTVPWEDAIHEGFVVFLRCKRKYHVQEGKHFMALFKTAWYRHFTDLCNEDTASRCILASDAIERNEHPESIGELENAGMLSIMLRQAPHEVKMVLTLFLNAPQELLQQAVGAWFDCRDNKSRLKTSKRINSLLGLPADFDSMKAVDDYFSS